MQGDSTVAADILARYAADAAAEVEGVRRLVGRRGARMLENGDVEIRLEAAWGASLPALGQQVQERVRGYLARMTDLDPPHVDVIVDAIGPAE